MERNEKVECERDKSMERLGQATFAEVDLQGVSTFAQEGSTGALKLDRATKDINRARARSYLQPERLKVANVPQSTAQEIGVQAGGQRVCPFATYTLHQFAYLGFLALMGDRLHPVTQ